MLVTVHVYDHIRHDLGRGRIDLEFPSGTTVADLLNHLAAEVHPLFAQLTDDDSGLYGVNLLVLDGERLRFPQDLTHPLAPGSELHLIPPISGG